MDTGLGKAVMIPVAQAKKSFGLISPVEVVKEGEKLRVVGDFTFGGGMTVRRKRG